MNRRHPSITIGKYGFPFFRKTNKQHYILNVPRGFKVFIPSISQLTETKELDDKTIDAKTIDAETIDTKTIDTKTIDATSSSDEEQIESIDPSPTSNMDEEQIESIDPSLTSNMNENTPLTNIEETPTDSKSKRQKLE